MLALLTYIGAAIIVAAALYEEICWHRAFNRRAAMRRRIEEYSAR